MTVADAAARVWARLLDLSTAGAAPALLGRVRLLFGLFALFNVVLLLPAWASRPGWATATALIASGLLAAAWTDTFLRGRMTGTARVLEPALIGSLAAGAAVPESVLGVFYVGLYFGALYGSRTVVLARGLAMFLGYAGGVVLSRGWSAAADPGVWSNGMGALLSSLVMALLADAVLRQSASEQARDAFLSVVSHELRTPTTAVLGLLETLQIHGDRIDQDARAFLIARAVANAKRQQDLIVDLLDVGRVLDGSMRVQPDVVVLDPFVREVVDLLDLQGEVRVDVDPCHTVAMDRHHLTQILVNLLSNASKYGAPPLEVSAVADPAARTVRVHVRDHGPGVPPAFQPRLFERFAQASTGDRRTSRGVGLGLWIARALAEANGARLHHDDTITDGACFTIVMPAASEVPWRPSPMPVSAR